MQCFVDDRGKSQTISFESLGATEQHEYILLQRSLLLRRQCCRCAKYFRSNTIGVPQPDHGRDHIDFETEPCIQWYGMSMNTVIFKLLKANGCTFRLSCMRCQETLNALVGAAINNKYI